MSHCWRWPTCTHDCCGIQDTGVWSPHLGELRREQRRVGICRPNKSIFYICQMFMLLHFTIGIFAVTGRSFCIFPLVVTNTASGVSAISLAMVSTFFMTSSITSTYLPPTNTRKQWFVEISLGFWKSFLISTDKVGMSNGVVDPKFTAKHCSTFLYWVWESIILCNNDCACNSRIAQRPTVSLRRKKGFPTVLHKTLLNLTFLRMFDSPTKLGFSGDFQRKKLLINFVSTTISREFL